MGKNVLLGLGVVVALIGCVWTLQGLGLIQGSAMTGVALWAVLGPLTVAAGLWMVVVALRARNRR